MLGNESEIQRESVISEIIFSYVMIILYIYTPMLLSFKIVSFIKNHTSYNTGNSVNAYYIYIQTQLKIQSAVFGVMSLVFFC